MEKLFDALINAWCWLRVAASTTLIGAGLGGAACYFLGGVAGLIAGGALTLLGLYFGIRLANHAQRADQLVEFAYGMSPGKNTSTEVLVRITGWLPGLQKVSMTQVIDRASGLGLRGAKSCTDRVLDGETVDVRVPDAEVGRELVRQLQALGAIADVEEDPA